MRIEILRDDNDPLIKELWHLFAPEPKEEWKILAYMSNDLGETGNKRGMVIHLPGLTSKEIRILTEKGKNPSSRNYEKEI